MASEPLGLPPVTLAMISAAVRRIVERFDPAKVILFGSHARGNASPYSDVDLLVVLDRCDNKREATARIYDELGGAGFAKDIVVTTPDEIMRHGKSFGTVLFPALEEGKVLYERE